MCCTSGCCSCGGVEGGNLIGKELVELELVLSLIGSELCLYRLEEGYRGLSFWQFCRLKAGLAQWKVRKDQIRRLGYPLESKPALALLGQIRQTCKRLRLAGTVPDFMSSLFPAG